MSIVDQEADKRENAMGNRYSKEVVKQAASGRWGEIISTLGGVDAAILDSFDTKERAT